MAYPQVMKCFPGLTLRHGQLDSIKSLFYRKLNPIGLLLQFFYGRIHSIS
jgi:hypothetical protein